MKKLKRIKIFVFTCILAVLMSVPSHADVTSTERATAAIDSQLLHLLQSASADEKFPVDIWLRETTTEEDREQKIYSKIGVNKALILADTKNTIATKKVDEYIVTARAVYAKEREGQYSAFKLSYANISGLQETRQADTHLFYSKYAPMISAELTVAEIKLLARDSRVLSIYYSPNAPLKSESNISIPLIHADFPRDTYGFKGGGVKIGLLEHEGLPQNSENYFTLSNIVVDDFVDETRTTPHATVVASIMIGKAVPDENVTYEGIVPDAQLFATYTGEGGRANWKVATEWLISRGVNVINMSAGLDEDEVPPGFYDAASRWLDHVAIIHNVHFVKSAGNTCAGITSPGMAYNIVTVGAINDKNTLTNYNDDEKYELSSFEEYVLQEKDSEVHPTNKPDLVAPGTQIVTAAGDKSGTSYAAPHVTAVIAQICEYRPSLRVCPEVVKAILTASITHGKFAYNCSISDAIDYDIYGAGLVDAQATFDTATNNRIVADVFSENGSANTEKTYTFTISSPQYVRVSLSWLKHSELSGSHASNIPAGPELADLDLYVINPDGLWIASSSGYYNNTEIVEFVAEDAGTYTIVVNRFKPSTEAVRFGLAWWLKLCV